MASSEEVTIAASLACACSADPVGSAVAGWIVGRFGSVFSEFFIYFLLKTFGTRQYKIETWPPGHPFLSGYVTGTIGVAPRVPQRYYILIVRAVTTTCGEREAPRQNHAPPEVGRELANLTQNARY